MSFTTKSYAERLRKAIVESDAEPDAERAVFIMKTAIEAEIKAVERIESMPAFRAWFEGERFNLAQVKARR